MDPSASDIIVTSAGTSASAPPTKKSQRRKKQSKPKATGVTPSLSKMARKLEPYKPNLPPSSVSEVQSTNPKQSFNLKGLIPPPEPPSSSPPSLLDDSNMTRISTVIEEESFDTKLSNERPLRTKQPFKSR